MALHVERVGEAGPTVVLVHGSGAPGWGAWEAVRPLAERYRLIVPHRSGFPPNPPLDGIDFDLQADEIAALIEPGAHLVGHSYGGVVALLAAARTGDRLRSLTVIEPPALGVARGDPAIEQFIDAVEEASALEGTPRDRLVAFLRVVGSTSEVPDPLPPGFEAITQANDAQRPPQEAEIPFEAIRATGVPVLVVTGGHLMVYDVIADVLERELHAERAILPGAGHSVQRLGSPFNDRLATFIGTADRRA
jgi:pimeloyl-ACP methyl ester carboxylesterase